MIILFKCPICGQGHNLMLTSTMLRGKVIDTVCPIMHETFKIKITLEFSIPVTFEKSDMQVAEEEARLSEYQWRIEEDVKDNNQ